MTTYDVTLLVAGVDEEGLDDIYDATDGAATVQIGDRWTSTIGLVWASEIADRVSRTPSPSTNWSRGSDVQAGSRPQCRETSVVALDRHGGMVCRLRAP